MMITFLKNSRKNYTLIKDKQEILTLDFLNSTITNSFFIITEYIDELSTLFGEEFDQWLISFLNDAKDKQDTDKIILINNNLNKIFEYVDKYNLIQNFDYSQFINHSKVKKGNIYFSEIDIRKIIRTSNYLKLYSLIFNTELHLKQISEHKKIFNFIINRLFDKKLIGSILDVIKTKTFRCNLTDRFMWDYINMLTCKEITDYTLELFNFIMNNILILCDNKKNPITYFVTVVDESLNWDLKSTYKDTIIYNDSLSIEDLESSSFNSLKSYCYNDTLAKLKSITYEKLYLYLNKNNIKSKNNIDNNIDEVSIMQKKLENIEFISPISEFLVYPIFSTILDIPYKYFITMNGENSAVLSFYLYTIIGKVFGNNFETIFNNLQLYPISRPPLTTTYKLKNMIYYYNKQNTVRQSYGFRSKNLIFEIIQSFIGKLSRIKFKNLINDNDITTISLSKLEIDMIDFFCLYFSNNLTNEINGLKNIIFNDF